MHVKPLALCRELGVFVFELIQVRMNLAIELAMDVFRLIRVELY
jgi:hypothetical protein